MTVDAVAAPPSGAEEGARSRLRASATPALLAVLVIASLGAAQGGYFPTSWGWAALPLLWATGITLVIHPGVLLSTPERWFVGAFLALTVWLAVSTVWSAAPAETVLELERTVLYAAAVSAALVLVRHSSLTFFLGGLLLAISGLSVFSLATRLLPDHVGVFDPTAVYRLAQPIGYWNGLALFVAMGALLATGFAARGRFIATRAASAAALVFLMPTFYFTFGRAGWVALALGLVVAVAADPRRLQFLVTLIVVTPAPALAMWLASRQKGLTRSGSGLERAANEGHKLAFIFLALAVASAAATALLATAERRVSVPRNVRLGFGAAVVIAVLVVGGAVFARYGGPPTLARKAYDAFKAPGPHPTNLNRRLFSFSGNGRADLWRIAWGDARKHPWLGSGPGTYERYYLARAPARLGRVRDAHGLYIETLAEVGPVGLALLVLALAIPLAVLAPARTYPLAPVAAGAYVAYLAHAGVDWDWEIPAVTLTGLFCAAAILIAARPQTSPRPLAPAARWVAVAAAVVLSVFAAVGLVGNSTLAASNSARAGGNLARAAADARTAHRWMPWSPAPWSALGLAELQAGLPSPARESFNKALSLDSGDWELWYNLARASSGRAHVRAMRRAIALFPHSGLRIQTREASGG